MSAGLNIERANESQLPMPHVFQLRSIGMLISVFATMAFGDDNDSIQTQLATPFEQSDGWVSASYEQGIRFCQSLAVSSPKVKLEVAGPSDALQFIWC